MPRTKTSKPTAGTSRPQTVPLEYAGKWIAWSPDGMRIVAVGKTFETCERAAAAAGFKANEVAIERIPVHRRLEG